MFILSGKELGASIPYKNIPIISEVFDYVNSGMVSEGAMKNQKIYSCLVEKQVNLPFEQEIVLYDPQTSGGLLIAINRKLAERALDLLNREGFTKSQIIGEVTETKEKKRIKIC